MESSRLQRINELARKSKTVGLTEEEKAEQTALRKEYIENVRMNIRAQLDNIDVVEADGSVTNLGEEYGRKKGH